MKRIVVCLMSLVVVTLTGCADQMEAYAKMTTSLHVQRLRAETAVRRVKQSFRPEQDQYKQVETSYDELYSLSNGLLTGLRMATTSRTLKSLTVEADNLDQSITAFLELAGQVTNQPTRAVTVGNVTGIVLPFLRLFIKSNTEQQAQALKVVERDLKWRSWSEIK